MQGGICTGDSGDHIGSLGWGGAYLVPTDQTVRRPSALICEVLRAMVA